MKNLIYLWMVYSAFMCIGCENEPLIENDNQEELCESTDEYFTTMMVNDSCWIAESMLITEFNGRRIFDIFFNTGQGFEEDLIMAVPLESEINKKYFFSEIFYSSISILEGRDAVVTWFEPNYTEESNKNWIEFDSINTNLHIYKGKFSGIFYESRIQQIYDISDTLVISEGRFRISKN